MDTRSGKVTEKPQTAKKKSSKDLKQTQDPATGADMEARLQAMLDVLSESLSTQMTTMSTKLSADIGSLRTEVNENIETLRSEVKTFKTELKEDVAAQNERIEAVEQRVAEVEERETILVNVVKKLSTRLTKSERRLDYAETKSRETNIRISNVDEKHDTPDMKECVAEIISAVLNIPEETLNIKNAHRVGESYNHIPPNIVVRFDSRDMKHKVLNTAWGIKKLEYHGRRIYFDQDFTSEIQDQRKGYKKIRAYLRENEIGSYIKAPAKLKVFDGDKVSIYNSPKEAEEAYGIYAPEQHKDDLGDWEAQLRKLGWEKVKK